MNSVRGIKINEPQVENLLFEEPFVSPDGKYVQCHMEQLDVLCVRVNRMPAGFIHSCIDAAPCHIKSFLQPSIVQPLSAYCIGTLLQVYGSLLDKDVDCHYDDLHHLKIQSRFIIPAVVVEGKGSDRKTHEIAVIVFYTVCGRHPLDLKAMMKSHGLYGYVNYCQKDYSLSIICTAQSVMIRSLGFYNTHCKYVVVKCVKHIG